MKRATQLGTVTFDTNSMFILEEFSPTNRPSESVESAANTDIVWVAIDSTPQITLESRSYGLITDAQRRTLLDMFEDVTSTYTLTYNDATTTQVRFRWEEPPTFEETYEGSCRYTATIPLATI